LPLACVEKPGEGSGVHAALKQGSTMGKYLRLIGELWQFLRVRKKWWLGPILLVLVLLSVFILLTEGSALAPFIYALF